MKIQSLFISLLFCFGSLGLQAQNMSCQEAMEIVSKNYDYRDNVVPIGSTMLAKVTYYTVDGSGYVVADIKSNQYDLQGRPYIFCGISSQQWAKFKSAGTYGSWGESFQNYVMNYTCNCNSYESPGLNQSYNRPSESIGNMGGQTNQFNPYYSQNPVTNMSPQQREIYHNARAAQHQQSVVALATLLEAIFTTTPEGRARREHKRRVKQNEKNDKQMKKVLIKQKKKNDKQMKEVLRLETLPIPSGGMEGWSSYLSVNLRYPTTARRMGIEGTVIVAFMVNTDGTVSDFELLRGIGGGCDEEAIRIIKNSPKWTPAMRDGKAVRTLMRLPINFKLVD